MDAAGFNRRLDYERVYRRVTADNAVPMSLGEARSYGYCDIQPGDTLQLESPKFGVQTYLIVDYDKEAQRLTTKPRKIDLSDYDKLTKEYDMDKAEYTSTVVARFGLTEQQAGLLHKLQRKNEWRDRVLVNLVAANMVAADGEGLELSLEALGLED